MSIQQAQTAIAQQPNAPAEAFSGGPLPAIPRAPKPETPEAAFQQTHAAYMKARASKAGDHLWKKLDGMWSACGRGFSTAQKVEFRGLADRWVPQFEEIAKLSEKDAQSRAFVSAQPAAASTPAATIDPLSIVSALAARGITLHASGGEIQASPAGLLRVADRETLKNHRAAILSALESKENF